MTKTSRPSYCGQLWGTRWLWVVTRSNLEDDCTNQGYSQLPSHVSLTSWQKYMRTYFLNLNFGIICLSFNIASYFTKCSVHSPFSWSASTKFKTTRLLKARTWSIDFGRSNSSYVLAYSGCIKNMWQEWDFQTTEAHCAYIICLLMVLLKQLRHLALDWRKWTIRFRVINLARCGSYQSPFFPYYLHFIFSKTFLLTSTKESGQSLHKRPISVPLT